MQYKWCDRHLQAGQLHCTDIHMTCHAITVNWEDMCFPHHPWLRPHANADSSRKKGTVHTSSLPVPIDIWSVPPSFCLLPDFPFYPRQVWHLVLSAPVALSSCSRWTPWLQTRFQERLFIDVFQSVWNLVFNRVFMVKYDSPRTRTTIFNTTHFVLTHSGKGRNHFPVEKLWPIVLPINKTPMAHQNWTAKHSMSIKWSTVVYRIQTV